MGLADETFSISSPETEKPSVRVEGIHHRHDQYPNPQSILRSPDPKYSFSRFCDGTVCPGCLRPSQSLLSCLPALLFITTPPSPLLPFLPFQHSPRHVPGALLSCRPPSKEAVTNIAKARKPAQLLLCGRGEASVRLILLPVSSSH